jgi:hypothetical protein
MFPPQGGRQNNSDRTNIMFPPEGGRHNNSDRTNIMFPPEGGRHNNSNTIYKLYMLVYCTVVRILN